MFVFFALLDTGSFALIVLATVVALVFHAAMYGPQAAFIAEMFPTRVRYTGASMGYQLAGILGGALAPIISVALLDRFDTSVVVSVYAVAMLAGHDRLRAARAGDLEARPARRHRVQPRDERRADRWIDLNSDLGEGFGIWTPRRRRRAARRGHQRQRRLRLPRRRPRHPAPGLCGGRRARRRDRRPGRLPRPARASAAGPSTSPRRR